MNILLVENSKTEREKFKSLLSELKIKLKVYEANNKEDALKIAKSKTIDFFFVDIKLKDSSGLDFGLEIRKIPRYKLSWIVFLSSYANYMFEAFKQIHCYDYIVKPYDTEKVKGIIKVLINNSNKNNSNNNDRKFGVFSNGSESFKIYLDEIIFLEINARTCTIHTKVGKYKLSRLPLKEALKIIDDPHIVKAHKSYAINTKYIRTIEKYSLTSWNIHFENYKEIALMGSKYKEEVIELFENHN